MNSARLAAALATAVLGLSCSATVQAPPGLVGRWETAGASRCRSECASLDRAGALCD